MMRTANPVLRVSRLTLVLLVLTVSSGAGSFRAPEEPKGTRSTPGLIFSSYLGGSGLEVAWNEPYPDLALAVDASGNTYLAGRTASLDFPSTAGSYQPALAGSEDGFVAKLNAAGQLVWASYLGGSGPDSLSAVRIGREGQIYLAGRTSSIDFPVTSSAIQRMLGGSQDGFLAILDASGQSLVYSSYVGGSGEDGIRDLVLDASASVYLAGWTFSKDFPTTDAAFRPWSESGEHSDAFVSKLSGDGSRWLYSTYLAGDGARDDVAQALAVDSAGSLWVIGQTDDPQFASGEAFQAGPGGGVDSFVVELNEAGSDLRFAALLGGSADDYGSAIALDPSGTVFLTGSTSSRDFPTSRDALGRSHQGGRWDLFLARLDPGSPQSLYSTYLGGRGDDGSDRWTPRLALDGSGHLYLAGQTFSNDFPVTSDALQSAFNWTRASEAFLMKLLASDKSEPPRLLFSTFLGGTGEDGALALAVDGRGVVHLAGLTASWDFPLLDPLRPALGGTPVDIFITWVGDPDLLPFRERTRPDGRSTGISSGTPTGRSDRPPFGEKSDPASGPKPLASSGPDEGALTVQEPTASTPDNYIRPGALPTRLRPGLSLLGDRLTKPGKERLEVTATFSVEDGLLPIPVTVIWQLPGSLRFEETGGSVVVFDGNQIRSSDGLVTREEEELIESLVFDSAEHFLQTQAGGFASLFLGTGFGSRQRSIDPTASVYDLYEVVDRPASVPEQYKFYQVNSKTQLLERVQYTRDRGGVKKRVEVRLEDWREIDGQHVAGRIVHLEEGRVAWTLGVLSVVFGPAGPEDIFTDPNLAY